MDNEAQGELLGRPDEPMGTARIDTREDAQAAHASLVHGLNHSQWAMAEMLRRLFDRAEDAESERAELASDVERLRAALTDALTDLSNTRANIMVDLAKGNDRWEGVPDLLKARIDGYRAALEARADG